MFHTRALIALVVCALAAATAPLAAQDADAVRNAKTATAIRVTEPIRVDGVLDEAAWELAEPATDFYQQEPDEGKIATRRTEVRFLYDDDTLYVGAMLFDSHPENLITNDLKREFDGFSTDSFGLVLDTFRDRRTAYGFLTNPGGAVRDTQTSDMGRVNDANWDGVWTSRTKILKDGWSLEFAIPFKTLRFPDRADQDWGLNIVRTSRAINERSTWSPVPRQFSHYNVSYAGALSGIAGVHSGNNLYLKPFATSSVKYGEPGTDGWNGHADGGIDMKWGITSSMLMDATWRTDFSQVEADEQQINLTRFSLFFPEKRQFFLESPASFQIGLQETGRNDLVPFFSRRIGLAGGQPVPVVGGVRLTGRAGQQTVGVLNMQTESYNGDPGDNFTALVLKRPLSRTTSLGGFYFGRESGGPDAFNRVAGFDFRFTPRRTFDVEAYAMHSSTDGQPGDWAGRTGFLLATNQNRARAFFMHIGESFQHDLGFVRRRGIGTLFGSYSRVFHPKNTKGPVREYWFGGSLETTGNDQYTELLTRIGTGTYNMTFADGGTIQSNLNHTFERLEAPFTIGSELKVPAGDYTYTDADITYTSNKSATLSGSAGVQGGEFWTGRQRGVNGSVRLRVNAHFAASSTFSRNVITLPEGSFTANLVGMRVETSFTPRMFLNAFIQYNGEIDAWLTNIRFNLIHRPLSDIYVVWNETRVPNDTRRALLLKYTHLIAF